MQMFAERIDNETPELHDEGVRMRFIGRREGVAPELIRRMEWAEDLTRDNDVIRFFVAFNYGGRAGNGRGPPGFPGATQGGIFPPLSPPQMHQPGLPVPPPGE